MSAFVARILVSMRGVSDEQSAPSPPRGLDSATQRILTKAWIEKKLAEMGFK